MKRITLNGNGGNGIRQIEREIQRYLDAFAPADRTHSSEFAAETGRLEDKVETLRVVVDSAVLKIDDTGERSAD